MTPKNGINDEAKNRMFFRLKLAFNPVTQYWRHFQMFRYGTKMHLRYNRLKKRLKSWKDPIPELPALKTYVDWIILVKYKKSWIRTNEDLIEKISSNRFQKKIQALYASVKLCPISVFPQPCSKVFHWNKAALSMVLV